MKFKTNLNQITFSFGIASLMAISITLSHSKSRAQSTDLFDQDGFSVEQTRNFSNLSQNNSAIRMSLAEVPEEFDCPLFSNSPYKDILTAIDGLQTAINVFPQCEAGDKNPELLTAISTELRQKILEAQTLQSKGETRKLSISAEQILTHATRLQDTIAKLTTIGQKNCYKSEDSRKLIFSINEAFQSIAPLALDFIAKNPALQTALAPYLQVVIGAQALSKGLSVLEFTMQYVPTLDMSQIENRKAIIKNTCSFMKFYNKIELLTLDRASRIDKINKDFAKKMTVSQKLKLSLTTGSESKMMMASSPVDSEILKIKSRLNRYQTILSRAADEINYQQRQISNLSICSAIKTVYRAQISKSILKDLDYLGELLNKKDETEFKKTKLEDLETEVNKPETFELVHDCAQVGQEWLTAMQEAFSEVKLLLSEYDSFSQTDSATTVDQIKIKREEKKLALELENNQKLKIFSDLSVFEPGELAKRIRGMPKYLFNGPQGDFYNLLQYKQNGPVFDFLNNNQNYYNKAFSQFKTQISIIQAFEKRQTEIEFTKTRPLSSRIHDQFYKKVIENMNTLPHLSLQFVKVGSIDHRELCDSSKLAIKSYVEMTDHLVSSEYLCKMITPVLKEAEVSSNLRRYCQTSRGHVTNTQVKAGYLELARPLFAPNGPKNQIELIMQKYDHLKCD